jgi:hypothetical protein
MMRKALAALMIIFSAGTAMAQRVGWVERSETHHLGVVVMLGRMMGFATLYPSHRPFAASTKFVKLACQP